MTTTLNMSYQNNPPTVAQGGTGIATNTAYGLLAAGTTSTAALQQAGTGTSGQIYLSGGASSLGTWTAGVSSSCFQYINSTAASSSASIAFTGLSSSYYAFLLILDAIVPATNAALLYVTLGLNGSYASSNYSYAIHSYTQGGTQEKTGGSSAAQIQLNVAGMVNTASYANNYRILMVNPTTSGSYNGFAFTGQYDDSSDGIVALYGEGSNSTTQAFNDISFAMSTGNISTGTFSIWGMLT